MDPALPLDELALVATSVEEDLGFVALADIAAALVGAHDNAYRLIGGHMVTMHAHRWNLGSELYRDTNDADLGITPILATQGTIEPILLCRGYRKTAGARFRRPVSDIPVSHSGARSSELPHDAVIDLLFPAYTSRTHDQRKHGELVSIEVRGLADALNRPAVRVELTLVRLNKQTVHANILLPDEGDALVLKAHAWDARAAEKDAVDVWRCLEVLSRVAIPPTRFEASDSKLAREIVQRDFATTNSKGTLALAVGKQLSVAARAALHTRIVALSEHCFGAP